MMSSDTYLPVHCLRPYQVGHSLALHFPSFRLYVRIPRPTDTPRVMVLSAYPFALTSEGSPCGVQCKGAE